MFLHFILFVSFLSLASFISASHPSGWTIGLHNILFLILCFFSAYKFCMGYFLFEKTVKQGWKISFWQFAWRFDETGLRQDHPIPFKEEFQATPFYSEKRTVWQNYIEALLLARGWDVETRQWREYVPLYTPQVIGTEDMMTDILKENGFLAVHYSTTAAEGAYGVRNLHAKTIFVPMAQFEEAREFIAGYYANNPSELKGLEKPAK